MAISCGIYSFTGSSIPIGVETFQVNYFENTAGGKNSVARYMVRMKWVKIQKA